MKNLRYVLASLSLLFVIALFVNCSGSGNSSSTPVVPKDTNIIDTNGYTGHAFTDWDIELKGYNVSTPPLTVTLSIMRVNQPGATAKYKYQVNHDQPWIDVSDQVNAVGYGEYCDIPLTFTEPGKYWITTKLFFQDDTWSGLYNSDFVVVTQPN